MAEDLEIAGLYSNLERLGNILGDMLEAIEYGFIDCEILRAKLGYPTTDAANELGILILIEGLAPGDVTSLG